jgi:hypothetical protein
MLPARSPSFVPAVSVNASPESIAEAVGSWQSRYQPMVPVSAPPPPPPQATAIETAPHLKEAAANWFAEARKQDQEDQDEVRQRVNRILGRNGLMG